MRINPHTLGSYEVPDDATGVALDIGANVGNWFAKFSTQFELVHAYEPLLACFNECCAKAATRRNVHVFQQGISDRCRIIRMMEHARGTAGSSAVAGVPHHQKGWVKPLGRATAITLPDAIARTGGEQIDYLKVDCECSEYPALVGADLSGVKYIGIELHWQLGVDKWRKLVEHIKTTHRWRIDPVWGKNRHNEVLAIRK